MCEEAEVDIHTPHEEEEEEGGLQSLSLALPQQQCRAKARRQPHLRVVTSSLIALAFIPRLLMGGSEDEVEDDSPQPLLQLA